MTDGNVEEFRAAERGEPVVRALVEREAQGVRERLESSGHLGSIDPAQIASQYRWLAGR
jgi:hypothetical protein